MNLDLDKNPTDSLPSFLPLLQYKVVGSCSHADLRFQAIQLTGIMLWTDPAEPLTVAQANLFLFKDSSYRLDYSEYEGSTQKVDRTEVGSYRFQNDELDLGELGRATLITTAGSRVGIEMTFAKDIMSVGLQGQKIEGRVTLVKDGPQTRTEICGP